MQSRFTTRPSGARLALQAWKSTGAAVAQMPFLISIILVTTLLLNFATYYLIFRGNSLVTTIPLRSLLNPYVNMVAQAMLVVPLAIAIHRYILLGEVTRVLPSFTSRNTWLFLGWTLTVQILSKALQRGIFIIVSWQNIGVLTAVWIIVMWIVAIYSAMIFPAVATNVPSAGPMQRIVKSVRQMRGRFWQFVGGAILSVGPLFILMQLFPSLVSKLMDDIISEMILKGLLAQGWLLVLSLVTSLQIVGTVAVAAALASWTYATLDLKE